MTNIEGGTMRLKSVGFLLTVSMLLTGATASGSVLTAGNAVVPDLYAGVALTPDVFSTRTLPSGIGTLRIGVDSLSEGVAFIFQLVVSANSPQTAYSLEVESFGSYLTDVFNAHTGYGSFSAGSIDATSASRSLDGTTLNIEWLAGVAPGQTSRPFVILTNASSVSLSTGTATVWYGNETNSAHTSHEPGGPPVTGVPEVGTLWLTVLGAAMFLAPRKRVET